MRPTLGRVVIFTRSSGEEFAARITRVLAKPITDAEVARVRQEWEAEDPTLDNIGASTVRSSLENVEGNYEVWLAVDIHTKIGGRTWYSDQPVAFNAQGGDLTWRWPEIVR
jgi:hypothetical protein